MRLRNLLFTALLYCLSVFPAAGAWEFPNANDNNVSIADNDALTFPDGDWTVCSNVRLISNAGSQGQYVFSWGVWNTTPSFNIWIQETSSGGNAGKILGRLVDNDGTGYTLTGGATPFTGNLNTNSVCVIRDGSYIYISVGGVDVTNVSTSGDFNAINRSDAFYFGMQANGNEELNGVISDTVFFNRDLTQAELDAMAGGVSPYCLGGAKLYLPAIGTYQELMKGLSTTNSGSTIAPHPRMYSCN